MTDFAQFPLASFAGIEFPISRCTVRGGIRVHNHEFPHAPGAEPEKLGRKLYIVQMTAHFHDLPEINEKFPELWPAQLRQLRVTFEAQHSDALVIPSIGSIPAFCTDWEQLADLERAISGEELNFTFQEDQDTEFFGNLAFATAPQDIVSAKSDLSAWLALTDFFGQPTPGIFDSINDLTTSIQGVIDRGDAFDNLVAGKLEQLANLCAQADRDVDALQHPSNWRAHDALKDLWSAANELAQDVQQKQQPIMQYSVPSVMAIGEVSAAIYNGDATRGGELLQLNPIEDGYAIPAGTIIRYRAAA